MIFWLEMQELVFKFELTKSTSHSGRERGESEVTAYSAQRINDDLRGRLIPGEFVTSNSPEELAGKIKEFVSKKARGREFRWEILYHPIEDERKRRGVSHSLHEDFDHDEIVRFDSGWGDSEFS